MITHVRTRFRLIPLSMIVQVGLMRDNPAHIYIIDRWRGREKFSRGGRAKSDIVVMDSPEAALHAAADIRLMMQCGKPGGIYARLFPPTHLKAPKGSDAGAWFVLVEHGDEGSFMAFANEMDARIEFDAIATRVHALDFTRVGLTL